jgi:hypothetical protein
VEEASTANFNWTLVIDRSYMGRVCDCLGTQWMRTHLRNPIFPCGLLRTSETITTVLSSPWKLHITHTKTLHTNTLRPRQDSIYADQIIHYIHI